MWRIWWHLPRWLLLYLVVFIYVDFPGFSTSPWLMNLEPLWADRLVCILCQSARRTWRRTFSTRTSRCCVRPRPARRWWTPTSWMTESRPSPRCSNRSGVQVWPIGPNSLVHSHIWWFVTVIYSFTYFPMPSFTLGQAIHFVMQGVEADFTHPLVHSSVA